VSRPRYVLGLVYSHDSSAALLRDGHPVVAVQQERLTRKKHDGSISSIDLDRCIRYCLDAEGIGLAEVDLVVENSPTIPYCRDRSAVLGLSAPRLLDEYPQDRIHFVSHHLAHAYLAYGTSPFEECACLVVDGQGNLAEDLSEKILPGVVRTPATDGPLIERQSVYIFSGASHTAVRKDMSPLHKSFTRTGGIGHLYETVSSYVFRSRHDAGKLMGLAPFGTPTTTMIQTGPDATLNFPRDWVSLHRHRPHPTRAQFAERFQEYADLAASAQESLEHAVLELARWVRHHTGQRHLAYSGGVALNCSANRAIERSGLFDQLYVAPPSSDCGISLGAAYYGALHVLGQQHSPVLYSDYLGREYAAADHEAALGLVTGADVNVRRPLSVTHAVAERLAANRIGGWFQGRSEFGPRALGNRSVLAHPGASETRDRLNRDIKRREMFRPFGPSVLSEHADTLFEGGSSLYMLSTSTVRSAFRERLQAVTHVDGSARIQRVEKSLNPLYHQLISDFQQMTGLPVLLNTSFNGPGEPIVETPSDAVRTFMALGLDFLALGPYLLEPRHASAEWGSGSGG
jgi:carbamoyltransferase